MIFGEGHGGASTAVQAADSGASIVDHGFGDVDERCLAPSASLEQCRSLAEVLRRHNTWVVLNRWPVDSGKEVHYGSRVTLNAVVGGDGTEFEKRMHEFWAGSLPSGKWLHVEKPADSNGILSIARRADLPMAAGTDASGGESLAQWREGQQSIDMPGFVLHGLLKQYVVEGLTPLAALQMATINPAKLLRATDSLGTVASGKLADLVLLDGDPLADITNTTAIRAVVANGRYYDRAALDGLMVEVRAKGP